MSRLTLLITLLFCAGTALGAVRSEELSYQTGDTTMKGYLALDDAIAGERPGVLLVHEWWGLNDFARDRARALAELGFTALAVDMYGQGKTASHPEDAKKFSGELRSNMPLAQKRFMAGLEQLKEHPTVDDEKIAAIGYCFGGGVVLEMARRGVDLDGVVSFHGSLPTDTPPGEGEVKTKVLVLNGGADPFITDEQLATFKKQMEGAGADYRVVTYGGAKHSFTNPEADENGKKFDLPLAYDRETDQESWKEMREFFASLWSGSPSNP